MAVSEITGQPLLNVDIPVFWGEVKSRPVLPTEGFMLPVAQVGQRESYRKRRPAKRTKTFKRRVSL
jgi:hypothetical protein